MSTKVYGIMYLLKKLTTLQYFFMIMKNFNNLIKQNHTRMEQVLGKYAKKNQKNRLKITIDNATE